MTTHDLKLWQHDHDFGTAAERNAERRTHWVIGLTFFAMLVELAAGWLTGSMAFEKIIAALPDHEIADLHLWRIGPASRACPPPS